MDGWIQYLFYIKTKSSTTDALLVTCKTTRAVNKIKKLKSIMKELIYKYYSRIKADLGDTSQAVQDTVENAIGFSSAESKKQKTSGTRPTAVSYFLTLKQIAINIYYSPSNTWQNVLKVAFITRIKNTKKTNFATRGDCQSK